MGPARPAGAAVKGPPSLQPLTERDPRRIGRYELEGRLGAGGMGTVYLGRSPSGWAVAVKTIHPHLAQEPHFRERFAREVAAARRVNGFYTAVVVDADPAAPTPWMATRYIEGPSLTDRVAAGGPLPADEVLHVAAGIAEALASIHAQGIVHRDLKPSNVVLAEDGPQVIDFGIARAVEPDGPATATAGLTGTGGLVGTFEYMSPEQTEAGLVPVGPPSDVFSLGGLLHFAATGRPAFGGGHPLELVHRIHDTEPDLAGIADARVRSLVAACLAKDPAARPDPARVVELATTPPPVRPAPPPAADVPALAPGGGRRIGGRRIGRRALLAGAVLSVGGLGAGGAAATRHLLRRDPASPHQTGALQAHFAAVRAVAVSPDGTSIAVADSRRDAALWTAASAAPVRRLVGHTGRVLAVAWAPDGLSLATSSQDETVRLWDAATGAARATLSGHTNWVEAVVFVPGGRTLVSAGRDATLRSWQVATGASPWTVEVDASLTSLACAPDGRALAAGTTTGVVTIRRVADGSTVRDVRAHPPGPVRAIGWSPDGRTLATAGDGAAVRLWDAATGAPVRDLGGHRGVVRALAFAPDGALLATVDDGGTVRLWDLRSGRAAHQVTDHPRGATAAAFGAGLLATAGADGAVRLRDAGTAAVRRVCPPQPGSAECLAHAPDGRTVATAGADRMVRIWDRAGAPVRSLPGHSDIVNDVSYSRDGRWLATACDDGTVRLWDPAAGKLLRTMLAPGSAGLPAYTVAFDPPSRVLLSCGVGGVLRMWDPATGALRRSVLGPDDEGSLGGLSVSPDGALVATSSSEGRVRTWAVADGTARQLFEGHTGWVYAVAFSPDGGTLASSGEDGTVRLWRAVDGTQTHVLRGHSDRVVVVAWSPDGAMLASCGRDGAVRVWDPRRGTARATLTGHDGPVNWVEFTPDGAGAVSAGADGTVRTWDLRPLSDGGAGANEEVHGGTAR